MSSRTGQVANGKGKEGGEAMNEAGYQTLIVKFSEPITVLDGMFDDAEAWGVDTLKGWIDNYESSRFTAIDSHTPVSFLHSIHTLPIYYTALSCRYPVSLQPFSCYRLLVSKHAGYVLFLHPRSSM